MKAEKTEPKFAIGQKVIFINDYGVNWGEKTITEYEWNEVRGHTYNYAPTDTPWFCTNERHLFDINDAAGIKAATVVVAVRPQKV